MSTQPVWKFIANLGDASPIDHGGLFLYQDETGAYGFECERLERCDESDDDDDDENTRWEVRRVCLDRCKMVDGHLVPFAYEKNWTHPVHTYREWFADSLASIAEYIGTNEGELREDLCSDDGKRRAFAYTAIGDYHGWDNLDSYPLTLTRAEIDARYTKGEV